MIKECSTNIDELLSNSD